MNEKTVLSQRLLTAEQGVLGSMLIDEAAVGPMLLAVSEEDFLVTENRNIFRAFKELYGLGRSPDPILVNERLGGAYGGQLSKLMELTPTAANAAAYAESLKSVSRLWRLQELGGKLAQAADLEEGRRLAEEANLLLCERGGVRRMDMLQGWKDFFLRHDAKTPKKYLPWVLSRLNEVLHVAGGDMVVIGGHPSAGKTALAIQLAFHIAKDRRVGFFSYETGAEKLFDRTVACECGVSYGRIMADTMERQDFQEVYSARQHFAGRQLEHLETAEMTVADIGAYAAARRYDVIVVDYLQKIPPRRQKRSVSEFERVSQVSSGLQQLGRRTGKTVIALSQLSRQEDKTGKPRPPTLSSLRQSGQIEQDADVVLLLYRTRLDDAAAPESARTLAVAKNKDGLAGRAILLDFDGDRQRFRQTVGQPLPSGPQKKRDEPAQASLFRPLPDGPSPFDGEAVPVNSESERST